MNPEIELARSCVEHTDTHIFLTGKAGTGKTTFLKQLRQSSPKRMIITAPTGIAAINAGGVTLHSFFQLPLGPYLPGTVMASNSSAFRISKQKIRIIRSLDLLVIDEISMVRADVLDSVDAVLRRLRVSDQPFGGVQLLMIGDLQQLAPVVKDEEWALLSKYYTTPFFFGSMALQQTNFLSIQLEKVYRQSDEQFLNMLNRIRTNDVDTALLAELNRRYIPDFNPPHKDGYIRLTTHNYQAQRVNDRELAALPGKLYTFKAEVKGNFADSSFPTDDLLSLKEGAQIMFVRNDSTGDQTGQKRYYNGKIGTVIAIRPNGSIMVRGHGDSDEFWLDKETWENTQYTLNEATGELTSVVEGTFRQYPIRLAWAITIHKSQGLTFERAIIDARSSFAHGQVYVALSRCKTLEGLVLERPLSPHSIICDERVNEFSREVERAVPGEDALRVMTQQYRYKLLNELFDFSVINFQMEQYLRLLETHYRKLNPLLLKMFQQAYPAFRSEIMDVAAKFRTQYTSLFHQVNDGTATDAMLQERIQAAAVYFLSKLIEIFNPLLDKTPAKNENNKEAQKRMEEYHPALRELLRVKKGLLDMVIAEGFTVETYMKKKANLLATADDMPGAKARPKAKPKYRGGK